MSDLKDFLIENGSLRKYYGDEVHVSIPNGVTTVCWSAFAECKNLVSVTLPQGVTRIDDTVFSDCKKLIQVTLPDSLTHIGEGAFRACEKLTQLALPNGVTYIGKEAFMGCKKLADIPLPQNVTHIGEYAFSGCTALVEIVLPEKITYISKGTFARCRKLKNIKILGEVDRVGEKAFEGCGEIDTLVTASSSVYKLMWFVLNSKNHNALLAKAIREKQTGEGIVFQIFRRRKMLITNAICQNDAEAIVYFLSVCERFPLEEYDDWIQKTESNPTLRTLFVEEKCKRYSAEEQDALAEKKAQKALGKL